MSYKKDRFLSIKQNLLAKQKAKQNIFFKLFKEKKFNSVLNNAIDTIFRKVSIFPENKS